MPHFVPADRRVYDVLIIGAGFYGCALAEHLAAKGRRVMICEAGAAPMERASAINQARVHTGFHYPRSFSTALRSWHNFGRFVDEFGDAIVRDFQMLYAISRFRTKVNAQRFVGMFEAIGAPIRAASPAQAALFSPKLVEGVFACTEYAFDYTVLRRILLERLAALPVTFAFGTQVRAITPTTTGALRVDCGTHGALEATQVFNITYAQINDVLAACGIAPLSLKHELVEIALIDPPGDIGNNAVTLMDGAFFSTMPYPAAKGYSLTHVRYTPHFSWTDFTSGGRSAYATAQALPRESRWRHMLNDARRYMPAIQKATYRKSLYEVKTVPVKNEKDDGRPILLHPHPELPGLVSILGSKIDNIYDLFDALG